MKTELSPQRQTEAIHALAAFGANGFPTEAAASILETVSGYWDSREGEDRGGTGRYLEQVALREFERLPPHDSFPVLTKALASENKNGQLFALLFVQQVLQAAAPVRANQKAFEEMLEDPKTLAALVQAAKSKDPFNREMAQSLLDRIGKVAPVTERK